MLSKHLTQLAKTNQRAFSSSYITAIKAREIIDSRGNPTVEADVHISDGNFFRAAVPSGASTGVYEALELRDKDKNRFNGKGCLQAVNNIHKHLEPALIGLDVTKQEKIDTLMVQTVDGTQNEWGWCK
jgi:enolase